MPAYNFADQYKAAGLSPGPDIIKLRQTAFEKLRKAITPDQVLDLSRLYFGLQTPNGVEWFRSAFYESDNSFSMVDNAREAAVLASCLLSAALEDENALAGLVLIVASMHGHRNPLVSAELVEQGRQSLALFAVSGRQTKSADCNLIKQPSKSKAMAPIDALAAAPDWAKAAEIMKLTSLEASEWTKNLANQTFSVVQPLIDQVRVLREEADMLWWYVGGWSKLLNKPFADFPIGVAAILAGIDLAHLTSSPVGPIAAPAILHRMIVASRPDGDAPVSIGVLVDQLPSGIFQQIGILERAKKVADLCPTLAALISREQIGANGVWHAAFKNATNLNETIAASALEHGLQVYREILICSHLE